MFYYQNENRTPNKIISNKVLYDIDTAEELASTRTKKKTSWSAVYKKKKGEIFLCFVDKDDDDGLLYLNAIETNIDKIQEYMGSHYSIKQYETVFGKVEE